MDVRPIVYDLCTGLHGWLEPFLLEGYRCIGYDIADMCAEIGQPRPEGIELRLRDITTIHGSELKDAALIVCSPPCQRYSYMAMPWSRAKAQASMIEADTTGEELKKLNLLFDTCFRLQREASEAAGHHIPMIVENVRGAQKWVGRAACHYGSFYLWGDVPALMPIVQSRKMKTTGSVDAEQSELHNCHINEMRDSLKVPGFRFDGSGKSFQTASVEAMRNKNPGGGSWDRSRPSHTEDHSWDSGAKTMGHANIRDGHSQTRHLTNQAESEVLRCSCPTECDCERPDTDPALISSECPVHNLNPHPALTCRIHGERADGVKSDGSGWTEKGSLASHNRLISNQGVKNGNDWFGSGDNCSLQRKASSQSNSRKAASAMIAKIPYPLASHIASTFKPQVIG